MSAVVRAVSALCLLLSLSCAGTLEEAGAIRSASEVPEISETRSVLTVKHAPGEPPVEVRQPEVVQALRMLSPQLGRVTADPDLARRRMLGTELPPELEGLLLDGAMEGHVVLASADLTDAQTKALTEAYFQHCKETHGRWGDCLTVMNGERYLGKHARYRLACHFALASVWDGMTKELGDMLNLDRIESAVIFGFATWAVLAVIPEPISKFLAVGLTVAMTAWLGVDALENVIGGWKEMATAADRATTLPELMAAGRAYGVRMGEQTVRLMVMLVASIIGEKGVANLPRLPKFNVAAQRLVVAGGPGLEVVSAAQQATVTGSRVTVVFAQAAKGVQAAAVAVAGAAGQGGPVECKEEEHHIGTVENEKATWNGGPWTPRLKRLFAQAGLSMESQYNKVKVFGHVGPHPREYHAIVFSRLETVLKFCGSDQAVCRAAFIQMLEKLAGEIRTQGTELNELVTRGCGKAR